MFIHLPLGPTKHAATIIYLVSHLTSVTTIMYVNTFTSWTYNTSCNYNMLKIETVTSVATINMFIHLPLGPTKHAATIICLV